MSWQIAIISNVFFYACAILLQRVLLSKGKVDSTAFAIVFQFVTGTLIGLYAFIIGDLQFEFNVEIVIRIMLMVCLYGVGGLLANKSLQKLDAGSFSILFALRGFFSVVAASVLLGDRMTMFQIIGGIVIFIGIIVSNLGGAKIEFTKSEMIAVFAALLVGVAAVNDSVVLDSFSVPLYVALGFFLPGVFVTIVQPKSIKNIKPLLTKKMLGGMLLLGFLYMFSSILYFVGIKTAPNVSLATVMNLISVPLIVVLGVIFLRERTYIVEKIVGAGLAFIGLVMMG